MLNDTVRIQPNKSRMQNIIKEKKKVERSAGMGKSVYFFSLKGVNHK